jgi:hypothetical protein
MQTEPRTPSSCPRTRLIATVVVTVGLLLGCSRSAELSLTRARAEVVQLEQASRGDVEEIRRGMPQGLDYLGKLLQGAEGKVRDDPAGARQRLERNRDRVQDLRVAKSTFFALVDTDGIVGRTDRDPDAMAGKSFFDAYPEARVVLSDKSIETRGVMAEASQVKGRADGQWVTAWPVKVDNAVRAVYATGWSWSGYAYRLENAARSQARGELAQGEKEPLIYVYVAVGESVFGAPVSPEVSAQAIRQQQVLGKLTGSDAVFATTISITDRSFALAAKRAPLLGTDVAIVVLRSET